MTDNSTLRRFVPWFVAVLLLIGGGTVWFALDPGFRPTPSTSPIVSKVPDDEFERRIRRYLLANPDVIVEALQQFEERQRAAEDADVQKVLASRSDEIERNPDHPVGGNPNGDVSLVEFLDYNCPYCRRVVPAMQEAEAADPNLRVVYIEFPILGPNSVFAAKAALAVNRQEKYRPFHMALMQSRGSIDERRVLEVAEAIGVDVVRMKSDMAAPEIEATIARNLALAQALRINGTPAFIVGQQVVRGATDAKTLQMLIHQARQDQTRK